jgi:hypothetical protein
VRRTAPSGAALRRLTDANRQEIRRAYWRGDTQVFLARAWDVSQSTIARTVKVLEVYPSQPAVNEVRPAAL